MARKNSATSRRDVLKSLGSSSLVGAGGLSLTTTNATADSSSLMPIVDQDDIVPVQLDPVKLGTIEIEELCGFFDHADSPLNDWLSDLGFEASAKGIGCATITVGGYGVANLPGASFGGLVCAGSLLGCALDDAIQMATPCTPVIDVYYVQNPGSSLQSKILLTVRCDGIDDPIEVAKSIGNWIQTLNSDVIYGQKFEHYVTRQMVIARGETFLEVAEEVKSELENAYVSAPSIDPEPVPIQPDPTAPDGTGGGFPIGGVKIPGGPPTLPPINIPDII